MTYRGLSQLALLVLLGSLVGCASGPSSKESGEPTANFDPVKDPYWEDPRWDKTLLDAIQAAVHDPVEPSDMSTPDLHATVKFTYLQGTLEYPEVVASTGHPDLDELMLHQLAAVQAPPATGLRSDEPHEFELDLDMPTPYEMFQSSIYAAVDYQKVYPKDSIISGTAANATVTFDYLDGKVNNVVVTASSKDKELDSASLHAVMRAAFPPPPAVYAGKSLHLQALFCYTLATAINGPPVTIKNQCPVARNVIVVHGTRIARTTIERGE